MFWQSSLSHLHLPPGSFFPGAGVPLSPRRGLLAPSSVCPFLSNFSGSKLGSLPACPGAGPCHLGTATHLACPHLGSWGSLGSPHVGNGHTSLNARGGVRQRQELQHPARIQIQMRNLVLTRPFFSFKNTKFELKIFRVKKPTI